MTMPQLRKLWKALQKWWSSDSDGTTGAPAATTATPAASEEGGPRTAAMQAESMESEMSAAEPPGLAEGRLVVELTATGEDRYSETTTAVARVDECGGFSDRGERRHGEHWCFPLQQGA